MLTRRGFLRLCGLSAGALVTLRYPSLRAWAQVTGGSLNPESIDKFATPLLIPPVMPKAGTIKQQGGKNVDYYEISMRQFEEQILPAGLAGDHGVGVRRGEIGHEERPAAAPRAFIDHRSRLEPAGAGQVDQ